MAVKSFSHIHSIFKKEVLQYSPHANGIIERNNLKITNLLKLYTNSLAHDEWDLYLETVENALNNSLNTTTGDTPAFIVFARDTCPVFNTDSFEPEHSNETAISIVQARAREALRIHQNIRNVIVNNTATRTQYKNLSRKDKIIRVGDRVIVRNHQRKHKLDLAWLGPGYVTEVKRTGCSVQIHTKTIKTNLNHVLLLKRIQ